MSSSLMLLLRLFQNICDIQNWNHDCGFYIYDRRDKNKTDQKWNLIDWNCGVLSDSREAEFTVHVPLISQKLRSYST